MIRQLSKTATSILVGTLLFVPLLQAFNAKVSDAKVSNQNHQVVYGNEKAIVFETMGGKKTDAYEGSIQVPENRNNPNSRMIPIKYVRFPATGSKKGSPIIYLSGGPGGSGIKTAQYPNFRFPLFMALREHGDVIALDQRGTGASNTTPTCISNQTLPMTEVLSESESSKLYKLAAKECLTFWKKEGVDVQGYTTVENSKDLDALRQHFQADKITLWGISYGSHLALASLKEMKGKIDRIVIASAEGLNQTVKLPASTDEYFSRLQTAINTQPDAAKQYPDIKSLIHRVHNKLSLKPMLVKIPQKDGSELDFLFQKVHMQILVAYMIADPQRGVSHLLALYKTLDMGSDDALKQVLKRGYFDDSPISFKVMSFAMDIASGITNDRLAKVNKQASTSLVGKMLNFPMPQLNKVVTGLDLGDTFREYPRSNVPTLLLTGTLDGRTYIESQKEATQGLTNLTHVIVKNAGHNLFMTSPKVTEVIKTFLSGDKVETKEIEIKLPSFLPKK